jgi:AraC-like DNA-binding protein
MNSINTSAMPSTARILIAHRCAVVAKGLASMLMRMPDWAVTVWDGEAAPNAQDTDISWVNVVIGDVASVSCLLTQVELRSPAGTPKFMVLTTHREEEIQLRRTISCGVDCHLSVHSPEDEVMDSLQRLIEGDPSRAVRCAARGGLAPGALRRVREVIETRLAQNFELGKLAAIAGLSDSHFSRAFKQSVGVPPYRYLVQRRIAVAMELIRQSRRSLTDIALEVGFCDQSHFTRMFSQLEGESPGAYRRRHQ